MSSINNLLVFLGDGVQYFDLCRYERRITLMILNAKT